MRTSRAWLLTVIMLVPAVLCAQNGDYSEGSSSFQRESQLRAGMLDLPGESGLLPVLQVQAEQGVKNPGLGALFSAVIPGTGEMYGDSWLKGALFLGVEVALWVGYIHFHGEGQEWEDIFHAYANEHWSEERWRDWMQWHPEFGDTTHSLPSTKTQQYYEMIGKYNQFKAGWDDYVDGGPALTENRNYYEELRNESNVQFKRASYCAMISLGNHILSAMDAALTIRSRNRTIQGQMRVGLKRTPLEYVPCLALRIKW